MVVTRTYAAQFLIAASLILFTQSIFANAGDPLLHQAAQQLGVKTKIIPQAAQSSSANHRQPGHQHHNAHQAHLRPHNHQLSRQERQRLARETHLRRLQENKRRRELARSKHKQRYAKNTQAVKRQPVRHTPGAQKRYYNVWQRIYQGFGINVNPQQSKIQSYIRRIKKNPVQLQRISQRASNYLYMVVNELNRRNMPTELALLPFVESAYKNTAYSHASAAGMWQFIPSTGRKFGLLQTRSYDARMDAYEATRAALDYLQKLHREFRGNWLHALAAYNAGEVRVHREIAKNRRQGKPTSYWYLKLPRETRNYIPKLLAYKEVLKNPYRYGIRPPAAPNSPLLATVNINKAVDLRKVAVHAGLPRYALTQLNPSYLHGITTPRYSQRIIFPRQYASRIHQAIHRLPAAKDVHHIKAKNLHRYRGRRYIIHKVRRGDNLYRIARKHGTTVKRIKRLNRLRSNKIRPGTRLRVAVGKGRKKYS